MKGEHRNGAEREPVDAIGVALIVFSAVVAAFGIWAIWRIFDPAPVDAEDLKTRTELVRNIGLFALGVVGLPLAIWRSIAASRQTREAIIQGSRVERQLAYTARQISASEENNLAKLLQDGAKLLADSDGANVTAGIATLSVVARTDPEPFGNQARVVLVDFVRKHGESTHVGSNVKRAIAALQAAHDTRPAAVVERLSFSEDHELSIRYDDYDTDWEIVRGAGSVTYYYGDISGKVLKGDLAGFQFRGVVFRNCEIDRMAGLFMDGCTLRRCRFTEIDCDSLSRNRLQGCDLSGVRVLINGPLPDLKAGGNFFVAGSPPVFEGEQGSIDVMSILHEGEPPGETDF